MTGKALQVAQLVAGSRPRETRQYLDNQILSAIQPGSVQEPVVQTIDRHLQNMAAAELLDLIWDEPDLQPLDVRLLPYQGSYSGKAFVFALARAAVVRQLPAAFKLTVSVR